MYTLRVWWYINSKSKPCCIVNVIQTAQNKQSILLCRFLLIYHSKKQNCVVLLLIDHQKHKVSIYSFVNVSTTAQSVVCVFKMLEPIKYFSKPNVSYHHNGIPFSYFRVNKVKILWWTYFSSIKIQSIKMQYVQDILFMNNPSIKRFYTWMLNAWSYYLKSLEKWFA